jgi:hypothetical protein
MDKVLGADIMDLLRPNGGWIMVGDEYEGIQFIDCVPVTKAEFDKALADYPKLLADNKAKAEADKESAQAKLAALGLTADDLKALGL